jgi:hypothetical protein
VGSGLSARERLVFIVVSCANLLPVWAFRYFVGQDTPNHLYGSEILRILLNGSAPANVGAVFASAVALKSNIVFHVLMVVLDRLGIPLDTGHRLFLSAYAVAFPAAGLYCVGRANPRSRSLALLLLPLVWNWFAVQGLYNFVFSLVPALIWLGIVARDGGRPRAPAVAGLVLASSAVVLAHTLTFLALLVVTAVRVLRPGDDSRVPPWSRLREALPLGVALAPSAILAGATMRNLLHSSAPSEPTLSTLEMYGVPDALGSFFVEFAMRYHAWDLLYLGPCLVALIVIPLLAAWQVRTQRRSARAPAPLGPKALPPPSWPLVSAALLGVCYLLVPHIFLGSDVAPRLRPLIVFCLLCYAGVGLSSRAKRQVAALGLISGLIGGAALAWDFAQFGRQLNDFTSGIPLVREGSRLYPMIFNPRGSSVLVRPFLHAWGYYGVARHVVTPFAFAWHETRFPLRYRELPLHEEGSALPSDGEDEPYALVQDRLCHSVRRYAPSLSCAAVRGQAEERLARLGRAYDYVLTWSAPGDFASLLTDRGYHLLHSQGALALYESPK